MVSGDTMSAWKILKTWWNLKNIKVIDLIMGNISVAGFNLSNIAQRQPFKLHGIIDKILELHSKGKIKPKIHAVYSFDNVSSIENISTVTSRKRKIFVIMGLDF